MSDKEKDPPYEKLESSLRKSLYAHTKLKVDFNLSDCLQDECQIIDLTFDAANKTRINHFNTREVREELGRAKLVVCDSPTLMELLKDAGPRKLSYIPYGHLEAKRARKVNDEIVFGLLNHNDVYLAANGFGRKVLNGLGRDLVVYGQSKALNLQVECTDVESLAEFATLVDMVLIPAHPLALISPTIPIALQGVGVGIIATATNSLQVLHKSRGAILIRQPTLKSWREALKGIKKTALAGLQDFSREFN